MNNLCLTMPNVYFHRKLWVFLLVSPSGVVIAEICNLQVNVVGRCWLWNLWWCGDIPVYMTWKPALYQPFYARHTWGQLALRGNDEWLHGHSSNEIKPQSPTQGSHPPQQVQTQTPPEMQSCSPFACLLPRINCALWSLCHTFLSTSGKIIYILLYFPLAQCPL